MNTLSDQLLDVARAFVEATGCDLNSASYRAFGDSRILQRLAESEASTTLRRADQAMLWFAENWPEGSDWPASVPCPHSLDSAASRRPSSCEAAGATSGVRS